MKKVFISAGEPSGDAHAAAVVAEMRALAPGLEVRALGGRLLEEAGATLVRHYREVAVVGLFEVLRHYPRIKGVFDAVAKDLETNRPDLLVLVDFPDFNLRLAAHAAALKIPVVYYISPQVWAWRRGRIAQIRERVRKMLVILPFEAPLYERAGVPVEFVGHPLADHYRAEELPRLGAEFRARHGYGAETPLVGLLPGSRRGEVSRVLPALAGAARLLAGEFPAARFVIPAQETLPDELFAAVRDNPAVQLVRGDYPGALAALDAVAVASGTATLECAWHTIPGCLVYRVAAPTYLLARMLVKVEHVGLANLVADLPDGQRVYPELIQGDCTPERIAAVLRPLLADPVARAAARGAFARVREKLGGPGASRHAAEAILRVLAESQAGPR